MYATLAHSKVKSWGNLTLAEGHNSREIDATNCDPDGMVPVELLDGAHGSYEERAERILHEHNVPRKLRQNGVLATEDIYGASPEYWGDWKSRSEKDLVDDPLVQEIIAHARRVHGNRLISLMLHLDESNPHVHVVALPLVYREHAKRGRKPKDGTVAPKVGRWSLAVSELRGGSRYALEEHHDAYASAVAHLGLKRGIRGSDQTPAQNKGRREQYTPKASVAEKVAKAERDRLGAEALKRRDFAGELLVKVDAFHDQADADRVVTAQDRAQAAEDTKITTAALEAAQAAYLRAKRLEAQAAEDRDAAARERIRIASEAKLLAEAREVVKAEKLQLKQLQDVAADGIARNDSIRSRLESAYAAAQDFLKKFEAVQRIGGLGAIVTAAVQAARNLEQSVSGLIRKPASETMPAQKAEPSLSPEQLAQFQAQVMQNARRGR